MREKTSSSLDEAWWKSPTMMKLCTIPLLLQLFTQSSIPTVSSFAPITPYPPKTTLSPPPTLTSLNTASGYDTEEEYSRCLTPKEERDQIRKEDTYAIIDESAEWKQALKKPFKFARRKLFPANVPKPGTLILVRCGESEWNRNYTFTGWADANLTPEGVQECEHAGRLLLEGGYEPDIIYTSRLKRAITSAWTIEQEINSAYLPVFKSWRLNERMYGSVTGLCKKETAKRLGADLVQAWRKSLKAKPPPIKPGDKYYPGNDRKYADMARDQIPLSESLQDCMDRTRPLWEYRIKRDLRRGNNVMVVAHGNTLRGLVKIIDNIGDKEITEVTMPTAIPFIYKFDKQMEPIRPSDDSLTQIHTTGTFLEKPGLLKQAMERVEKWQQQVPGTDDSMDVKRIAKRMTTLEKSLLKLREEQEKVKLAEQLSEDADANAEGQVILVNGAPNQVLDSDEGEFEESAKPSASKTQSTSTEKVTPNVGQVDVQKDPVVVFIRHGRTPHNQLALFTGWEDPPLAKDGVEDAKEAGRLLKRHGFEFDVVYTSWLTRAIETAWYVTEELDQLWLPLIKSWRLNERHYGALTGKSKKMVANIHGEDQLKKWRRGYTIKPPPTSSYSFSYPGNDYKRTKYVKDLRISFRETLFRSLEERKFQTHRKFPKSESLKCCMDRSIPFYTQKIVPESVAQGKRVLITSHENAIRGILMHLCEIPEDKMNDLHLPNGLPLVYNVRRKCISLLDDGTGRDPLEVYSFGSAAEYLFRPCELLDEDFMVEPSSETTKQEKIAA